MGNEIMDIAETAMIQQSELKLHNKKLLQHTKAIEKLMIATKKNMFEISARLLIIKTENLYTDDEFKDVFDYAEKLLGWKKNMVYKMIVTAEKFIEQAPDGKGYISILAHEDSDYTVSKLMELNTLEPATVQELDEKQIISPDMTAREIREVVKAYKNGEIDDNGEWIENEDDGGQKVDNKIEKIVNSIVKNIDKLLKDERIDETMAAKLEEFQSFVSEIQVHKVNE